MSWWSSLSNLWSKRTLKDEECDDLRRALVEEQRALASDVESLFQAYDEKLRSVSSRLQTLSDEELDAEAADIRATQDALKRMVRRVEASAKASRDLERELAGWEHRSDDAPFHADHPDVRAEMIRSELAARNPSLKRARRSDIEPSVPVQIVVSNETVDGPELEAIPFLAASDPLPQADPMQLVAAIREATREAERWHAVPTEDHDEDALMQLHHLRDLHALLKAIDRDQGVRRDRMEMAVQTRA